MKKPYEIYVTAAELDHLLASGFTWTWNQEKVEDCLLAYRLSRLPLN